MTGRRFVVRSAGPGALAALVLGGVGAAAPPSPQDVERGKQAARENALLPGHREFSRTARSEAHEIIDPLLETCALRDCYGAGVSNTYVVRLRADGTFAQVFVEPSNPFTTCLAEGLEAGGRLKSRPPRDDYWIQWSVSGTMPLPAGCRAEVSPPIWPTLKWWLFMAGDVFPRGALRVRILLVALSILPFVVALGAWKLLRPDDGGRTLLVCLLVGTALVLGAAGAAYGIGSVAKENRYENRENVVLSVLLFFPLLSAAPFAFRGLWRPRLPRGARRRPEVGPLRRAIGILTLLAALLPALGLAWFAAHENAHRLCPTCVSSYKLW